METQQVGDDVGRGLGRIAFRDTRSAQKPTEHLPVARGLTQAAVFHRVQQRSRDVACGSADVHQPDDIDGVEEREQRVLLDVASSVELRQQRRRRGGVGGTTRPDFLWAGDREVAIAIANVFH